MYDENLKEAMNEMDTTNDVVAREKVSYKFKYRSCKSMPIITGISNLWDKTMVDKLLYTSAMMKHYYPFCRLKLVVETFENST